MKIKPISSEIKKLRNEIDYLDKILLDGQKKANEFASNKLKKMHEIVGFLIKFFKEVSILQLLIIY